MTALASRRRRDTWLATGLIVGLLTIAGVLTLVGARTLADSTLGREVVVFDDSPTLRLPHTATAFLGVVGDEGHLTTAAVLVLAPDGTGGSIVSFASIADSASNQALDVYPLDDAWIEGEEDLLRLDVEALTGVGVDLFEVVSADRLVEVMEPLGELGELFIDLDDPVFDPSTDAAWPSGEQGFSVERVLRLLAARNPGAVTDTDLIEVRTKVWDSIAEGVGSGLQSLDGRFTPGELSASTTPADLGGFVERLFSDRVSHRAIAHAPVDAERNPREVEVVFHDPSEVVMVFAQIAPARVGAPLSGATFRLESVFASDDLVGVVVDGVPVSGADIALLAVDRIRAASGNVLSVSATSSGLAPQVTRVLVADDDQIEVAAESFALLFGTVEVSLAEERIDGVDVQVILGLAFLEDLDADIETRLVGSVFEVAGDESGDGVIDE